MRFSQYFGPAVLAALMLSSACSGAATVSVGPSAAPTTSAAPATDASVAPSTAPAASPSAAAPSNAAQAVLLIDGQRANIASDFKMTPGATMSFQFGHQGDAAKQGDVLLAIVIKDVGAGQHGYAVNIADLKAGVTSPKVYTSGANVAGSTTDGRITKREGAFDFTFKATLQDNNKTESHLMEITATLPY